MYTNKTVRWTAAIVALIGCMPVGAGEAKDEIKGVLSVCGGDQAIALVRLDLARIDVDAAFDLARQCVSRGMGEEAAGRITTAWEGLRKGAPARMTALRAAGAGALHIVWNVQDLPLFVMAVPIPAGVNEQGLREAAGALGRDFCEEGRHWGVIRKADVFLVGPARSLQTIEQGTTTAPGPQWDRAVEQAQDRAVQVLLGPNEDSRRVLEEMLPIVTGQRIQVPGHALTRGLQWGAISLDWPPRMALRAHVQSADHQSAEGLRQLVAQGLDVVVESLGLRSGDPNQGAGLDLLYPEVVGNALRLDLDTGRCYRLLNEGIVPVMARVRAMAQRQICMTNLSGLGKAMLLYANDFNDRWPPTLETLIEKAEVPAVMLRCRGGDIGDPGNSYAYRGVDLGGIWVEPLMILVHDRKYRHQGGRNVLFVDSHVQWATEEQFQQLIAEDNRLRRKAKLPEKPAAD